MAFFTDVPVAKPTFVFHLNDMCKRDPEPNKLNLGVGAFRDGKGAPVTMTAVQEVEMEMARDVKSGKLNHEYPPQGGSAELVKLTAELALGKDSSSVMARQVQGVQALSGTGALRIVAEFLHDFHSRDSPVLVSNPTWGNHYDIFGSTGLTVKPYRYYDEATRGLDFTGLMQDLRRAPRGAAVILHACAHNPTGVDPSRDQWEAIAGVCRDRGLLPIFDSAYLGYVSGDPEADAFALRIFDQMGLNFFVCVSFSKNMGLYSERCGVTLYRASSVAEAEAVNSQFKIISRRIWSVPPMHGANIAIRILSDPARRQQWLSELQEQAGRIRRIRHEVYNALHARDPHRNWTHVIKQTGMFSYTGLSAAHCQKLIDDHHVYLLMSGRINVCGIADDAVDRFADAVYAVVGPCPRNALEAPSVESLDSFMDSTSDQEGGLSASEDVDIGEDDDDEAATSSDDAAVASEEETPVSLSDDSASLHVEDDADGMSP